jgi:hypothetical protein
MMPSLTALTPRSSISGVLAAVAPHGSMPVSATEAGS